MKGKYTCYCKTKLENFSTVSKALVEKKAQTEQNHKGHQSSRADAKEVKDVFIRAPLICNAIITVACAVVDEALEQWMKQVMKTLAMQEQDLVKQHTNTREHFFKKQQVKMKPDAFSNKAPNSNQGTYFQPRGDLISPHG